MPYMTRERHTFTDVPAADVKIGDRFHSLGRGFIGRDVVSVERLCNCQCGARTIDPETREPLHFESVRIVAGELTSYFRPESLVTLSDGAL